MFYDRGIPQDDHTGTWQPYHPSSSLPASRFQILSQVAQELKWFPNLPNPDPRRAYRQNIQDLMAFAGLHQSEQFWEITRAVIT